MAVKAKEQVTLIDITDAYSVVLTSESYIFAGNTSGAPVNSSCSTQVVAYQGNALVQKVNVTKVECPTGISATISDNNSVSPTITFKATAVVSASCEATITVKVDDVTFNKKFSFSVAKTGATGAKGDAGAAGKGVKSIIEQYYKSTSATSLAGGSWSTTYPGWENGKYIWTRSAITYTDSNTPVYTTAICVTGQKGDTGSKGDKGDKGETGANGKSIGSVVNYYLATNSSSNVTTGTSGWTTTVQSVSADKKYLWNYEVIKYTDGTIASISVPCIIGAYGDKGNTGSTGATGNGISKITEHYAVSTSNTTAPITWQDTPPAMSATNKYLWNYETITYTSGSTSDTNKRVIGVYGDKGNTGATGATGPQGPQGATGNGISKITEHYQVSTSNTTAPTSWQDTPPAMTSTNKYLWNYETITYTSGSPVDTKKRVIGVYGDKGAAGSNGINGTNGKSIGSVVNYYLATNSSSGVGTGTSGWTTTVQSVSADKKYLWNYEVIKYTDGSVASTSAPCIIGAYGDKGNTGTSVSKTIRYYKLQDSFADTPSKPTSNPPSGWTTTEPTYASGKSLYFVDCTVYSTGSIIFSDVSKSSSYTATNDLKDQYDEFKMHYRFDSTGQYIGKENSNTTIHTTNDRMEILVNSEAVTTIDTNGFNADQLTVNKIIVGDFIIDASISGILRIV